MPRFVILRHEPGPNSIRALHWDLMFEWGDALRTFACLHEPSLGHRLSVQRLADHRLHYLDYEGPVSGGRGDVTRWDAGVFSLLEETAQQWRLDVDGTRWNGPVTLEAVDPENWTVTAAS